MGPERGTAVRHTSLAAGPAVPKVDPAATVLPPPGTTTVAQPTSADITYWPLGRLMSEEERARALGTYSHERYRQHLEKLEGGLAARMAARRQQQAAALEEVDALVGAVRQLGAPRGPPGLPAKQWPTAETYNSGSDTDSLLIAALPAAAVETPLAGPRVPAAPAEQAVGEGPSPAVEDPTQGWEDDEDESASSPVAEFAAASLSARRTGSPGSRVKPIMQVKGEQDRALRELAAGPRRFVASPLPLSTAGPRYQQLVEEWERGMEEGHNQRLEQLVREQRPFSFQQRDQQRQQARLAAAAQPQQDREAAGAAVGGSRPRTPATFHAQPVPISTTEVGC